MNRNIYRKTGEHSYMKILLRGTCVSFMITVPTFAVMAFLLGYTDFPWAFTSILAPATAIVSVFLGAFTATRGLKRNGMLNGATIGLIYMAVAYIGRLVFLQQWQLSWVLLRMLVIFVIVGAIGGTAGINKKKHVRDGMREGFYDSLNKRLDK